MGNCGGQFATSRVTLDVGKSVQLVSTLETRTITTVKADPLNPGPVFITSDQATRGDAGYPLFPGEGYVFGGDRNGRAARAAVYAYARIADCTVSVIQEGE